ncbi:MAG: glycosyltransferase [Bdellovibrionales bacterium]|nr:glycosyltransferase [Bdellovibrionales bacterium]
MKLLWVLPKWPLPMQDGARVANISLIQGLSQLGQTLDVVAVAGQDEIVNLEELKKIAPIRNALVIRREKAAPRSSLAGIIGLLKALMARPWLAMTLFPYAAKSISSELNQLVSKETYDFIVYDGLHPAAHSSSFGTYVPQKGFPRIVYRAHNVEADIWTRKAAQTGFFLVKWMIHFQAALMRRFENSLARHAAAVMTVSEVDWNRFKVQIPQLKGTVVPIGYDFGSEPERSTHDHQVLFLGKLDWPPNRDGLIWLLEKVWPQVIKRRPELKLLVAGSGSSEGLNDLLQAPGVKFLGRVPSVEAIYRECLVALVPVFYGSGTRVKAIEASRYGRACLGTEIGVEGLGLVENETYIRAESAEQWIDQLSALNGDQAKVIGDRAYAKLKSGFHLPEVAKAFVAALKP